MSLGVMSFLIVCSIYIDWIRFYNELNTRHYKNVQQLCAVMPYVYSYHVHYGYGLNKFNRRYINAGDFDKYFQFSKILLQRLSNDNLILYDHILTH